jgi:dUTP pyrophosphatase
METPIVRCTGRQAPLPEYQSEGAAGADLCAQLSDELVLKPGMRALVPTGLFMQIPAGLEAQVRPRSGLAVKNGVTVLNSPGTIDSDYRGEIKVLLINLGEEDFRIRSGDRIAQIVFGPAFHVIFKQEEQIDESARGGGGFGSTGV